MDLSPVQEGAQLSDEAIEDWTIITEDFFREALTTRLVGLNPPISDVVVSVVLLFAAPPGDAIGTNVLRIEYLTTVGFQSSSTAYDPAVLSLESARDSSYVVAYVQRLTRTGNSIFDDLLSIRLELRTSNSIPPPPTEAPTVSPTVNPTDTPTVNPTEEPSPSPTLQPSVAPQATPTFSLTAAPTPTAANPDPTADRPSFFTPSSVLESEAPTAVDDPPQAAPVVVLVTKYATTQLRLEETPGPLSIPVLNVWANVTAVYLEEYIQFVDPSLDPQVEITSILQTHDGADRRRRRRLYATPGGRRLQSTGDLAPLLMEFVTKLDLPEQYDADSLVNGAFATRNRRNEYRDRLIDVFSTVDGGSIFGENLTQVIYISDNTEDSSTETPVAAPTERTPEPTNNVDAKAGGSSSGGLIGGIVAGLVVLLGAGFFVWKRRESEDESSKESSAGTNEAAGTKRLSPTSSHGNSPPPVPTKEGLTWEAAEQPSRLNQEIVVENMDDVSTIGDPLYYGNGTGMDTDDKTATTSVLQTDTYNSLLGRARELAGNDARSTSESKGDVTEFSAFTGMTKYLQPSSGNSNGNRASNPGLGVTATILGDFAGDETSFEKRLFPMDKEDEDEEDRSLDFSYPTALMDP